jgi:hypothetical protein
VFLFILLVETFTLNPFESGFLRELSKIATDRALVDRFIDPSQYDPEFAKRLSRMSSRDLGDRATRLAQQAMGTTGIPDRSGLATKPIPGLTRLGIGVNQDNEPRTPMTQEERAVRLSRRGSDPFKHYKYRTFKQRLESKAPPYGL